MATGWSHAATDMKGGEKAPEKKIKHVVVRHAANGGHIIEHHHTHPEHHPMEEHTTKGDDAMAGHMMDTMGSANPGEAPGSAPEAGAPPAEMGGGASPAGAPPMPGM